VSGRLDGSGVLHDTGWQRPQLALDGAMRDLPTAPATTGIDAALKDLQAQRETPSQSPMAQLIPGYDRLR
jgi:hypothetical protein